MYCIVAQLIVAISSMLLLSPGPCLRLNCWQGQLHPGPGPGVSNLRRKNSSNTIIQIKGERSADRQDRENRRNTFIHFIKGQRKQITCIMDESHGMDQTTELLFPCPFCLNKCQVKKAFDDRSSCFLNLIVTKVHPVVGVVLKVMIAFW